MQEIWEGELRRWHAKQTLSVPGWIGSIEIAGRSFFIQAWFAVQPGTDGAFSLEFLRRIGGKILVTTCELRVHKDKQDVAEPDLVGSIHIAERDMVVGLWMSRDEHNTKLFKLKVTPLSEEGLEVTEAKPSPRPPTRQGLRLAPRSRY